LFEKEQYPFHKVCGEYISMESWNYLQHLGLQLREMEVSKINQLRITGTNGVCIRHSLQPGGFGISRYSLDNALAANAISCGVLLSENSKVTDVTKDGNEYLVHADRIYTARIVCGSFGKRSNLDVKWKRNFISSGKRSLNNFIGIKYHVKGDIPVNEISLHNFKNGYCGVVKIEGDKYCLCYLTTAANLQKCGNDISAMERTILSQNPYLKDLFAKVEWINKIPLTISQVSFDKKPLVENNCMMLGDAAGMITPLCGNGMSMALHSSKFAATFISSFLWGKMSRQELEQYYIDQWQLHFKQRLQNGRLLQSIFGQPIVTNSFLQLVKPFPRVIDWMVSKTHGKTF
jgi:flavin-dependent dehydrogenase